MTQDEAVMPGFSFCLRVPFHIARQNVALPILFEEN